MQDRKILIVAPDVFGIMTAVTSHFENQGYVVDFRDDRHNQGFLRNVVLRFNRSLFFTTFSRGVTRILTEISNDYEKVIIINGEGFNLTHIIELSEKGKTSSFYTWDSVKNKRYLKSFFRSLSGRLDFIGTFDFLDSQRFGVAYKPLFSKEFGFIETEDRYSFSFIGTMHSRRLQFLSSYLAGSESKIEDAFVALYCKNLATYLFHLFMNLRLLRTYIRFVKIGFLPLKEFEKIMSCSELVLDYSHPNQAGLTHRCVTALRNGKNVLTNNPHVENAERVEIKGLNFYIVKASEQNKNAFSLSTWAKGF